MQTQYLNIDDERRTVVTRERSSSDRWDADDLHHDLVSINGYTCVSKNEYFEVTCDVVPEDNAAVYLVVVRHSTGDSFHSETGCIQYVAAYGTRENAERVAKAIVDHDENRGDSDRYRITVTLANGTVDTISASAWTGYFERLERVDIETVTPMRTRSFFPR